MNTDEKICWDNDCCHEMNDYFNEHVKPFSKDELIKKYYHFNIVNQILHEINKPNSFLLDLGCGTGNMSILCDEYSYYGSDLKHILDKCARVNYPDFNYIECDIKKNNIKWIEHFDIILMSALVDIMDEPLKILSKILKHSKNYVILHRQEMTFGKTRITINPSYGFKTYHSIINISDFRDILDKHKFKIVSSYNLDYEWEFGGNSYLLQKYD